MTTCGPFTVHPALAVLPLMEGDDFALLVEDIKREGLRQPITLNHDKTILIDGRNRYQACEEATVDPVFETLPERYTDEMVRNFIVSANLRRQQHGLVAVDPNAGEIELAEGVLTIKLPGLTAVRIDTHRGSVAIDCVSGQSNGITEWTVRDLRHGVYGDFHLLRPVDDCTDRECASQHTA